VANTPSSSSGAASTSSTVRSATALPVSGQRVRLIVTVTPVPVGGTVRFLADGRPIAGCRAVAVNAGTGESICVTRFARAGVLKIQAIYSGKSSFSGSLSSVLNQSVGWSLTMDAAPRVRAGMVVSRLSCAPRSGGCPITVVLTIRIPAVGGKHRQHSVVVGQRRLTVSAGHRRTVAVGLSATGQSMLAQRKRLTVEETIYLMIDRHRAVVTASRVTRGNR
jgi:hypothetical protein